MSRIRGDVLADRRRQVLGGPRFRGRQQPGPHSLALPLQVGQNVLSRSFVPATGRDFDDDAIAVAVAGNVGSRLIADALGSVFPGRYGRRSRLPLPVSPSGEPHPLALDDLGIPR
jgi:hypothetical protein